MIATPLFRRLAGRIAILLAAGTLAACQVDVSEGGPDYRPRPQVCTMEYNPVCGDRRGRLQTFPNACEARSNGFDVVGRGECRPSRPDREETRGCTREYAPVCGARGCDRQTFANACEARSNGFGIVGRGECRPSRPDREEIRGCTREYAPVCGARGRDRQTFANACEARSSGFDVIGRGECQIRRPDSGWTDGGRDRDRPDWRDRDGDRRDRDRNRERPRDQQRACTMEYNPVCGQRGRSLQTFGNACSAQAEGYRVVQPGACPAR